MGSEEEVQLVFAALFSISTTVGGQNEDFSFVKLFGLLMARVTLIGIKSNPGG